MPKNFPGVGEQSDMIAVIVGEGALFYYFTVWQHVWFLYCGCQESGYQSFLLGVLRKTSGKQDSHMLHYN